MKNSYWQGSHPRSMLQVVPNPLDAVRHEPTTRVKCLEEILESERYYVNCLREVMQVSGY